MKILNLSAYASIFLMHFKITHLNFINLLINKIAHLIKKIEKCISGNNFFFYLCGRASLLRPAPFELPQGGNTARVEGCSGAIEGACPFFYPLTP
ncbi:hypothetical protein ASE74_19080 [Pedobacter sp. Leaf216]|nr:hypothetical protein ASE74_19080 [Pedobacter sp. Leaf216]